MSQPTTSDELRAKQLAYQRLLEVAKELLEELEEIGYGPGMGSISMLMRRLRKAVEECECEPNHQSH